MLQGVLQACDVPFVGSGVLSSSVCMSKHITKQLLQQNGIQSAPWLLAKAGSPAPDYQAVSNALGSTVFVKPNAQGSSVGVHRVHDEASYRHALRDAFTYDDQVLIEQAVVAREIECSVLGNEQPRVAQPGEVVCQSSFYSFDAKYVSPDAAKTVSPADLTVPQVQALQQVALATYRVLQCAGLARVDLFLTADDEVLVNEVNTLPGFTNISLYARNWQVSGMSNTAMLQQLIDLALATYQRRQQIRTSLAVH